MKKLSTKSLKSQLDLLTRLNKEAKDLVKIGEFRRLSDKLVKIIDDSEISNFFQKSFAIEDVSLEETDKLRLEYEILRCKVFIFQHLSYYDALGAKKDEASIPSNTPEKEKNSLGNLFQKLNRLNEVEIVTLEAIEKEAKFAYEEICKNTESRNSWKAKHPIEKKLWQEKVWLILCDVNVKFHLDRLDESLTKLQRLEKFVFDKLADDENFELDVEKNEEQFACFTTKATLLALIANCQNMKGELREAEANYYQAIKYYTEKAKHPKGINGTEDLEESIRNNIKFQFRRTAQIFIYGLLKVNAKKSNIDRCKANLLITELLLTDQITDETTFLMLDFSKAVIKRIEAGTNRDLLKQAKENVLAVKRKLKILSHKTLIAEVNFELAILNHLLKNWAEAESLLKEVENYYDETLYRMKANITILRAHIERARGQLVDSVELAREAVNYSKQSNNIVVKIDAAICLAESCFASNKIGNKTEEDAYKLFERSLALNEQMQSPKIEAICLLGLSKVSAFRKEQEKARVFYERFQNIKQFCQHKFVFDELIKQAEAEIDSLRNLFIINSKVDGLVYEKHLEDLRLWLYSKAKENSLTDEEIANKLNISRQSVLAWRSRLGLNSKKSK